MENIKKYWLYGLLSLIGLIFLVIAVTISIYFLYTIPKQNNDKLSFEQQKWDQEQKEKEMKKAAEDAKISQSQEEKENKEMKLDACINDAIITYSNEWDSYCAIWKAEAKDTYENCKKRLTNTGYYTLQEAKDSCWTSTPDYKENPTKTSCLLPPKFSNIVDGDLKANKDECYKKYS